MNNGRGIGKLKGMRFRRPSTPSPLAGQVEMEGRSRRREKTDRRESRKQHDSAYIALPPPDTAALLRPLGRSNIEASFQGDLSAVGSGEAPRPTARAALTCFWTA